MQSAQRDEEKPDYPARSGDDAGRNGLMRGHPQPQSGEGKSCTIETVSTSRFYRCLSTMLILLHRVTAAYSPTPSHEFQRLWRDRTDRAGQQC
jgi:hypothetical protein